MYHVPLTRIDTVADGTKLFVFKKPQGFEYQAGQSVDVTLIEPSETDAEGPMRAYSLVSAPHEDWVGFATRMRDTAFKRVMGSMAVGTEVRMDGPFGSFFLHDAVSRPAVFLVGGIGVTPFFSMLKDATHRHLGHAVYMLYSNRKPEDAAFLKELRGLESENAKFTFVPTMTESEKSNMPWTGEHGYITLEMIKKYVPAAATPIYYLAGPKPMVTTMRNLLTTAGISNDDIRFEEFSGY